MRAAVGRFVKGVCIDKCIVAYTQIFNEHKYIYISTYTLIVFQEERLSGEGKERERERIIRSLHLID